MALLGFPLGLAQVPDDFDVFSIRDTEDLNNFLAILENKIFQKHVIEGFKHGPCRSFKLVRTSAWGVDPSNGYDLVSGSIDFGNKGDSKLYRVSFVYLPYGIPGANLWVKTQTTSNSPSPEIVLRNETVFWFLVHVFKIQPRQLVNPLKSSDIIAIRGEHVSSNNPRVQLRITYANPLAVRHMTISAEVGSQIPLEFGELIYK